MVEIKSTEEGRTPSPVEDITEGGEKYRLLYSKSKVYVQPTAYAKDNIPGFAVLVKRVTISRTTPKLLLTFSTRRQ